MYRPDRESYDDALDRVDHLLARLRGAPHLESLGRPGAGGATADGWSSNTTRAEFERRVERARAYIAAGDVFQIVISQRFSKPLRTDPHTLYRHLRELNPSPYMYHLNLGAGRHVVGASPELLVKVDGRAVQTRPLAGTRRRGADRDADLALERELLSDPKERGEHVMLVDLGRHDLGRVCAPGTVRVDKLMAIERFSHVMHISSTVTGALSPRSTSLDAVRSTFPAGTLSGAPKIRAMEIIAELEAERRGVYGGAVGWVGFGGATDLAIGLRTIVIADGRLYVQAGAGIVADSNPEAEYQETLHKANAMFAAVRDAEATT